MNDIFQRIESLGVLPELTLNDAIDAISIGQAISDGGISMAEVTFRTKAAKDSIRLMSSALPDMLIGAGTVLTVEQVDEAMEAGAKFIVTPGISRSVVEYCVDRNIPIIPGVANPTDIERAIRFGLKLVKFFPAEACGGIEALKAMSAPYPDIRFMPTGGITQDKLEGYLNYEKVLAVSGNWMTSQEMIENNALELIRESCKKAVVSMLGFSLDHVGVNFHKDEEALFAAEEWMKYFDVDLFDDDFGFFAGKFFEAVRPGGIGRFGHIAISTYHIGRAIAYLEKRGASFDMDRARYDAKGNITEVFMNQEIGGMAVLLIQR